MNKATNSRQAKCWAYIDKPSDTAAICNYAVVATPNSYEERASDYRIIVGNKNNTELLMSGMENTVLLDQYYEAKLNLQNNAYVPNVGEYWYKYQRNSTSVITILSSVTDIRFKVLDVNLNVEYDSAAYPSTHRTSFVGGWICAERARLTTLVGSEHYLVVYCTKPDESVPLRSGSMATAVGNPVMGTGSTTISPGISVTATSSGYSPTRTFSVTGGSIPNTAQVDSVTLYGTIGSNLLRWRLMAPKQSSWTTTKSNCSLYINFNFTKDSTHNAYLKGIWSNAFQAANSSYSFTPFYLISYYYEYGD